MFPRRDLSLGHTLHRKRVEYWRWHVQMTVRYSLRGKHHISPCTKHISEISHTGCRQDLFRSPGVMDGSILPDLTPWSMYFSRRCSVWCWWLASIIMLNEPDWEMRDKDKHSRSDSGQYHLISIAFTPRLLHACLFHVQFLHEDLQHPDVQKALHHWTGHSRLAEDEADELMEDNYRWVSTEKEWDKKRGRRLISLPCPKIISRNQTDFCLQTLCTVKYMELR